MNKYSSLLPDIADLGYLSVILLLDIRTANVEKKDKNVGREVVGVEFFRKKLWDATLITYRAVT